MKGRNRQKSNRRSGRLPPLAAEHTKSEVALESVSRQSWEGSSATRYFYFDSEDQHIRKALLNEGWRETQLLTHHSLDLLWLYNNDKLECEAVKKLSGPYLNHFKNNHLLTTKQGLRSSIQHHWAGIQPSNRVYPRTYDLHNSMDDFIWDFKRTAMLNLLKKMMVYVEMYGPAKQSLLKQRVSFIDVIKEQKVQKVANPNFLFPMTQFIYSLCWFEHWKRKIEGDDEQPFIDTYVEAHLVKFSQLDPPYHEHQQNEEDWATPTIRLLALLLSYSQYFDKKLPFYRCDGFNNIWIVKPSQSSKGRNLQLISSIEEARQFSVTCRVVQKYLENVWTFTEREVGRYASGEVPKDLQHLLNKKFDIRVWVLVKSFQPLEIWIFDECYLRLATETYGVDRIDNMKCHLTNFSINKNEEKSVVMMSSLMKHLEAIYGHRHLQNDIDQLIVDTIKTGQMAQVIPRLKSFELYGFDIILDCDLKPWLLEVNMSPACKQRGDLVGVLDEMAVGLLQIVGLIPKQDRIGRWRQLYMQKRQNSRSIPLNLALNGRGIDMENLYTLQRYQNTILSVNKIQFFVKSRKTSSCLTKEDKVKARTINLLSTLCDIQRLAKIKTAFSCIKQHKKRKVMNTAYLSTLKIKSKPLLL